MWDFFSSERLSEHVTTIHMPLGDAVYLVVGNERALLLDSGYGIGDLRGYVDTLTGLPVALLLTHGHLDHAGGAGQFGTVYLNHADDGLAVRQTTPEYRYRFLAAAPDGACPREVRGPGDLVPQADGNFRGLSDGDELDLGGVCVLVIAVPGHTHGMMVPVIIEDRIAVFGDACGEHTMINLPDSTTIAEYRKSLLHLKGLEGLWDTVVRNHGTHWSPKSILDRNLMLCERILDGSDDAVPLDTPYGPSLVASAEEGPDVHGNIIYRANDPRRE